MAARASGQMKTSRGRKCVKKKSQFDFFSIFSSGSTSYWSRAAEATAACGGLREPEQGPPSEFSRTAPRSAENSGNGNPDSPDLFMGGYGVPRGGRAEESKPPLSSSRSAKQMACSLKNRRCKNDKPLLCGKIQLKIEFCSSPYFPPQPKEKPNSIALPNKLYLLQCIKFCKMLQKFS